MDGHKYTSLLADMGAYEYVIAARAPCGCKMLSAPTIPTVCLDSPWQLQIRFEGTLNCSMVIEQTLRTCRFGNLVIAVVGPDYVLDSATVWRVGVERPMKTVCAVDDVLKVRLGDRRTRVRAGERLATTSISTSSSSSSNNGGGSMENVAGIES